MRKKIRIPNEITIMHPDGAVLLVAWRTGVAGHVELRVCIFLAILTTPKFKPPINFPGRHRIKCSFTGQSPRILHLSGNWPEHLINIRVPFLKAEKERVEERKEDLAIAINDYKKSSTERRERYSQKQDMITELTSNLACFKQSEHKLTAEDKNLIIVNIKLLNKSSKHHMVLHLQHMRRSLPQ